MKPWVLYAFLSMLFAGVTSVIAKMGLTGISWELGLFVRTLFVSAFVLGFGVLTVPLRQWSSLTPHNWVWLAASALATACSWIFYYRALKDGDVSKIAVIDKGSMVVAVLLAWWFLKEQVSPRTLLGAGLMVAGLVVIARK